MNAEEDCGECAEGVRRMCRGRAESKTSAGERDERRERGGEDRPTLHSPSLSGTLSTLVGNRERLSSLSTVTRSL